MSAQPVRIGVLRLLDSAPVMIAREFGYFAQAGMDATVVIEPSWANIADKLAYGMLDAAVMLGPLAVAMALGLRGRQTDLRFGGTLSRNGNTVVLGAGVTPATLAMGGAAGDVAKFAVVHGFSNHDLLARGWLASHDVPLAAVRVMVLPPADMVEALARGSIAGFCAGAPWGSVAVDRGVGRIVAVSAEMAPDHPEKMLMLRGAVADAQPMLAAALRDALGAATALCGQAEGRAALAELLAAPQNLAVPEAVLAASLVPIGGNPVFMTGVGLRPDPADLRWTIDRMRREGYLAGTDPAQAEAQLLWRSG